MSRTDAAQTSKERQLHLITYKASISLIQHVLHALLFILDYVCALRNYNTQQPRIHNTTKQL